MKGVVGLRCQGGPSYIDLATDERIQIVSMSEENKNGSQSRQNQNEDLCQDEFSQIDEDADSWINFQKQKSKIDEDDQDSMNRLWVVIRNTSVGDSENHFELQGGERIKVGRVVLTVKELCNDKVSYCAQDS